MSTKKQRSLEIDAALMKIYRKDVDTFRREVGKLLQRIHDKLGQPALSMLLNGSLLGGRWSSSDPRWRAFLRDSPRKSGTLSVRCRRVEAVEAQPKKKKGAKK